jgi:chemotaxis protein CheD
VGLGSCVAILLHDAVAKVGGLAHILLPSPGLSRQDGNPAKFPDCGPPAARADVHVGREPRAITARLAGGASMFSALAPPGTIQMGERNVVASREVLSGHGIPLVAEAVGGDYGRTVKLQVACGTVEVSSLAHGCQTL